MPKTQPNLTLGAALALGVVLLCNSSAMHAADAAKIIGAGKCGECHKQEVRAWKSSKHHEADSIPITDEGEKIAKALGIADVEADSSCLGCHFTVKGNDGGEPVSGVSCESCHGAAADWVESHGNYGDGVEKQDESESHRKSRIEKSLANGMLRPERIYDVAANCLQCHTVPNERLVNVGGHKAGSDFDLVAWSQGEVRHNFSDGNTNEETSAERKRLLHLIGWSLDLEYSLRGLVKVTKKGDYRTAMARRVARAKSKLEKVHDAVALPEVKQMLDAVGSAKKRSEIQAAADTVGAAARALADAHDGSKLGALDPLIATKFKGEPLR